MLPTILMVPVSGGFLLSLTWSNGSSTGPGRVLNLDDALAWIKRYAEER
jgi:hypothetical protein